MNFTVGKYKTRDGRDAVVVVDWREHQVISHRNFPLVGYIEGSRNLIEWTKNGRAYYEGLSDSDLMPPAPRRAEKIVYLVNHPTQEEIVVGTYWHNIPDTYYNKKYKLILEEVQE